MWQTNGGRIQANLIHCYGSPVELYGGWSKKVGELENLVDQYEDELGTYLVKLSRQNLSVHDSHTLSIVLHCIGDFERISDHAINIMEAAQEMHDKS